eukprot:COSAG01_NODE_33137_length_569_cov_2.853191_1_plen_113_part_00
MSVNFYADIVCNFFTGLADRSTGKIIVDKSRIARKYLRTWFTIDLISTVELDILVDWLSGNRLHQDAVAVLRLLQVSQNGYLLSRRGRSLPANASGFDTHRDSISSRFDCRS